MKERKNRKEKMMETTINSGYQEKKKRNIVWKKECKKDV